MTQELPVAQLTEWISRMGERGLYPKTTARFRAGAIEALTSVLSPDEPNDLEWTLEHLDELGKRWATLKHANPKTASTYVSRARTALEDYLQYMNDPSSFKGRRRKSKKKQGNSPPRVTSTRSDLPPGSGHLMHTTPAALPLRSFPLSDEQDFRYSLPPSGITVVEALRVFYHLVTLARDFDPTDPKQAKIFSLVRSE